MTHAITPPQTRSPSPAAPRASASRSSREFAAAARGSAFVARTAQRGRRHARAAGAHGIVGDVARKDDIHPIALQITGGARRAGCADQQRLQPRAASARAARRHRMRGLRARAGDERARPVPIDQARCSARWPRRRAKAAAPWCSTSRATLRSMPYPGWGAYGASKAALRHMSAHLGRGARGRGRALPLARSGRHGHAAARARPCPTPIPATLKRPETAARELPTRSKRPCAEGATHDRRGPKPGAAAARARLLVVDARGAPDARGARAARRAPAAGRPGRRQRRGDAAGEPARRPRAERRRRSRCGWRAARRSARRRRHAFSAVVFGAATVARAPRIGPPPRRSRRATRSALGPLARAVIERARASAPGRAALRWRGRRGVGRHRAARAADPVRARARAARALGRLDADRRACRSPSSRRRLASRSTGHARGAARARRRVRDDHPRGRHLLDRRSGARRAPAARRAVPHPASTASAIRRAQANGGRIVAVGTTVVRALEHAARDGVVRAGHGVANQRIGPYTRLRVVDAILSGTHEPREEPLPAAARLPG